MGVQSWRDRGEEGVVEEYGELMAREAAWSSNERVWKSQQQDAGGELGQGRNGW
jgi:hypothetical protein